MGELYLDGELVGEVFVRGWQSSWGFGEFHPNERFSAFAPVFGQWAMLMHEDERERLSVAASDELSVAEQAMDGIRSQLFLRELNEWRDVRQLNIDGELIEWKE